MTENTESKSDISTGKNLQREDIENLLISTRYLASQLADNIENSPVSVEEPPDIDGKVYKNFFRSSNNLVKTAWAYKVKEEESKKQQSATVIRKVNSTVFRQFKLSFRTLYTATRNNIDDDSWESEELKDNLDNFFDATSYNELTHRQASEALGLWNEFHKTLYNCGMQNIQYRKLDGVEAYLNTYNGGI